MTETNANGRFTIWVDGDERYDVTAADPDDMYTFTAPDDADGLRVDDDETHEIGTFMARTFAAGGTQARRVCVWKTMPTLYRHGRVRSFEVQRHKSG